VAEAKAEVDKQLVLPAGYALTWSGQYEYMERAMARLPTWCH
jgi:Cu(I)/Ag(I) efflux system membrane protein CusA/SilA